MAATAIAQTSAVAGHFSRASRLPSNACHAIPKAALFNWTNSSVRNVALKAERAEPVCDCAKGAMSAALSAAQIEAMMANALAGAGFDAEIDIVLKIGAGLHGEAAIFSRRDVEIGEACLLAQRVDQRGIRAAGQFGRRAGEDSKVDRRS